MDTSDFGHRRELAAAMLMGGCGHDLVLSKGGCNTQIQAGDNVKIIIYQIGKPDRVEWGELLMRRPDGSVTVAIDGGTVTDFQAGTFEMQKASLD